ncbi:MAG: NUDIX domain-containing protein [Propionibacteriales bacterium]|nr:NUDIX domain-containing protein [Propionibacteriales bacterium]
MTIVSNSTSKTARVIPVDADGRVMLLRGEPQNGRDHWFTVGGAINPDELPNQAAVRELREETGIEVESAALREPFYVGPHAFVYNEQQYETTAHFYALAMDPTTPVSFAGLEPGEVVEEVAWRHPGEFNVNDASTPALGDLMSLAVRHLAG